VKAKVNWWPLLDGGLILPILSMPQPLNGHGLTIGFFLTLVPSVSSRTSDLPNILYNILSNLQAWWANNILIA
jgi:hypothetical protein